MKTTYNIQWSLTNLDRLEDEHYAHLFMLVRNGRIVYIGNSFRRRIMKYIPATMEAAGLNSGQTQIFLGRVREMIGLNSPKVTEFQELLTYARKPVYNVHGKLDFKPKNYFTLHNFGCNLLPSSLRADQWGVYQSQRPAAEGYAVA